MDLVFGRTLRMASTKSLPKTPAKTIIDKRYTLLKDILYFKSTRPEISLTEFEREQHEVIERMWALQKEREVLNLEENLRKKYTVMRRAAEELERIDERLFKGACISEAEGYESGQAVQPFSGKLRVPVDTASV